MNNYLLHLRTYLIIKRKRIANALSFHKTNDYIPFVILSEPRSGSTLLHTYLNYHPHIQSYGEVLRENLEVKKMNVIDPLQSFVFKPHPTKLKAIGLKLFYYYYDSPIYTNCFKQTIQNTNIKIIHLIRTDVLALYVSLKMAQHTNRWSSVTSSGKHHHQLNVNIGDFRKFLQTYLQHQQDFKILFQYHNLLIITYEDMVNNPDSVLKNVQEFLGVIPRPLFSMLKKQNLKPIQSFVINYEEVKSMINENL